MGLLSSCAPAAAPENAPTTTRQVTPVVRWNEVMLAAVRNGPPKPTVVTRQLFIVHTAMYDAWTAYDTTAVPLYTPLIRRPQVEHTPDFKAEAISYAAYDTLTFLFADYESESGAFAALMAELGFDPDREGPATGPAAVGRRAAAAVLAARAADGSNWENDFADATSPTYPILYSPINSADPSSPSSFGAPDFNPNFWTPLRVPTGRETNRFGWPIADPEIPASFVDQRFLTPHWGAVTPFALSSGAQFRPGPPPQYGSPLLYTDALGQTMRSDEAFRRQFTEVLLYSATLTDEQKIIAEYWADGPRSETPPGHWNALAHGLCYRDRHTIDQDVQLFFALNGALLDASIAAWDAKRHYDFVRPITAIRYLYAGSMVEAWNGPDRGSGWILADTWRPYQDLTFVTPAFPEYVSGHSTYSAAAAAVLERFTGTPRFYDGRTELPQDFNGDGRPDLLGEHIVPAGQGYFEEGPSEEVILRWPTLQAAADEAGISRLYGGIHIQDGDLRGREMGRQIGEQALSAAERLWAGSP